MMSNYGRMASRAMLEVSPDPELVTNASLVVLCSLDLDGPRRPGVLQELTGLSSGGVSKLLDRMEGAGVVKRAYGGVPGDNRGVLVSITRRGRALTARCSGRRGRSASGRRATWSRRSPRCWRRRQSAVILLVVAGLALLGGSIAGARRPVIPAPEQRVFRAVNGWPDWLYPVLWLPMQLGNLVVGTVRRHRRRRRPRRLVGDHLGARGDAAQAGDRAGDPPPARRHPRRAPAPGHEHAGGDPARRRARRWPELPVRARPAGHRHRRRRRRRRPVVGGR